MRGRSVLSVLELIGVDDGPADPLDQLAGEMVGLEVGGADPLSVDDAGGVLRGVGNYEYLRHESLLRWVSQEWPPKLGCKSKLGKDSVKSLACGLTEG
jgi:hypothetical protein